MTINKGQSKSQRIFFLMFLNFDEEPCYKKRLISEMLNIKKQKNSLNLQTDTKSLYKAYLPIINKV